MIGLAKAVNSDQRLVSKLKSRIDFLLILEFEASRLGVTMGFYPVVMNGEARIIDMQTGETVESIPLSNQKGLATSFVAAEKKALTKLARSLSKPLKTFLTK